MPLRDHFRPPLSTKKSWEGLHGGWPMMIVRQLANVLPAEFSAEPRVHLGPFFEIDVSAYVDDAPHDRDWPTPSEPGGVATVWAPPRPTLSVDAVLADDYEYAIEIYDESRGRTLVAAIELVSPANKDRPEHRRAFAAKCASLLKRCVCVSLVDLVTNRDFNLYRETLEQLGQTIDAESSPVYAATSRYRTVDQRLRFESWAYPLAIGQRLPNLPIWLANDLVVGLDLDAAYEETCQSLRIA